MAGSDAGTTVVNLYQAALEVDMWCHGSMLIAAGGCTAELRVAPHALK